MLPRFTLSVDEINLTDLDLWVRPLDEREGIFETLRTERPVAFFEEPEIAVEGMEAGPGYYAITKHEDILEISRQPELYCSGKGATSITDLPEFMNDFFGSMINMDDPRHARLRRIVSAAFTPKMLKRVEDNVQTCAAAVVDGLLEKGTGDFVTEVAAKLPLKVICDMMGIPESDYDTVFTRSNIILGSSDTEYVDQTDASKVIEQLLMAGGDLHQLVSSLGQFRRENPGDDLTTALVQANVDGEALTDQELGSFFILLVVAGNETTRNAISHGLELLTKNPEQKAIWAADFEGVLSTGVEEIVRVASPVVWMRRTVSADTTLRGVDLKEGDKLMLNYWSANRDSDAFANPFEFQVRRSPNPHVGFGGPGPHFCLGAHLARREIGVMFRELFARTPNLVATSEPERLRSSFINGIKHLECSVNG